MKKGNSCENDIFINFEAELQETTNLKLDTNSVMKKAKNLHLFPFITKQKPAPCLFPK